MIIYPETLTEWFWLAGGLIGGIALTVSVVLEKWWLSRLLAWLLFWRRKGPRP